MSDPTTTADSAACQRCGWPLEPAECDHDTRESALAWAVRAFAPVAIHDADALADVVLHLASQYHVWLTKEDT